jgi:thiamine pyrophosphate-dependent acetolactate synthase large subunit-like protein
MGQSVPCAIGAKYAHPDRPAIAVDDPDAVGPAWDEALAGQAPVVLDMRTDPEVQIAKNEAAELLPRAGLHSKIDG